MVAVQGARRGLSFALRPNPRAHGGNEVMAANLQVLLDHRPAANVSPVNFRLVETPYSDSRAGTGAGQASVSLARPLHARAAERREILRQAPGVGRSHARGHGRRRRGLGEPELQEGRRRRRDGRVAALRARRRARPAGDRREGDPDPGLSRTGWHAGRHRVVRSQQDHRAQGGRNGARLGGDRSRRLRRRPTGARGQRPRGRHCRRNRKMRLRRRRSSATPPASTTSRRSSPRS